MSKTKKAVIIGSVLVGIGVIIGFRMERSI